MRSSADSVEVSLMLQSITPIFDVSSPRPCRRGGLKDVNSRPHPIKTISNNDSHVVSIL